MDAVEHAAESPQAAMARLEQALAAKNQEIDLLQEELDSTNRGVVALYAELDAQADQLRHTTELKSRFLAYMSHEFRVPIGAIRSIARLLMDRVDGPLTAEQETQVRFIQDTTAEFSDMVNDLLDLAKVEAGRVDVSPAWFEMVDLFSALRGMFRPVLTNPEVSLVFEEPQGVPALFNDNRRLAQILRNFISNALKFTSKGEVRISAKLIEDDHVVFTVTDTGMGIDSRYHHAIFEDFVQVESPVQKRLPGTGLGLSLSKQLAALLGGRVWMESTPGVGSTFSVSLPVRVAPQQAEGTGSA